MRGRVLVIEDDAAIRRGIADALAASGYQALSEGDGDGGLAAALAADVDLVLLDVVLPRRDGFSVLEQVRRVRPTLPVIMLTARGAEQDRVRGLQTGADDYVVKPFSVTELLARVEAVLRRSASRPLPVQSLALGGRTVDFARRLVLGADGSSSELTELESELLRYLAANPARIVTRDELLANVWRLDARGLATRTVDMAVARLREKLGDDPAAPQVLRTVRGKGYVLAAPAPNPP
jgi:DNA-binding response OmpR family regulator